MRVALKGWGLIKTNHKTTKNMTHEFNAQLSKLNRRMSALTADLNTLRQQRAEATGKQLAEYDTEIVNKLCEVEQTANHIASLAYELLAEA